MRSGRCWSTAGPASRALLRKASACSTGPNGSSGTPGRCARKCTLSTMALLENSGWLRSRPHWRWLKHSRRRFARAIPRSSTILSRTSVEILALLENLEIDAGLTYLDNEPLGRVTAIPLYRERYRLLVAADAPRRPQPGDLGRGRASAFVSAHSRHAEPPHYRTAAARHRQRSAYLDRIDDLALLACAYWTLGERNAGAARYDAWSHRCPAFDSNRGSGSNAHDRIGGASTRANDDVDRCARRRSTACRTAIVGLKSKTRELASMKLFNTQ
jgi:hypothetical protein